MKLIEWLNKHPRGIVRLETNSIGRPNIHASDPYKWSHMGGNPATWTPEELDKWFERVLIFEKDYEAGGAEKGEKQ